MVSTVVSSAVYFLNPNGIVPNGDYTGLNIAINGAADPIFRINPAWAAAHPEIAQKIVITRTFVPGPPTKLVAEIWPFSRVPAVIDPDSDIIIPVAILGTSTIRWFGH